jgi:hypothetical protein
MTALVQHFFRMARALVPAVLVSLGVHAIAGEGHDHGDAAPAATGTASPRLTAHSDLFELVGIADKGRMTLYLDRYATNEPVTGAKIEYESGTNKGVATPRTDGTYLIQFDALGKSGELPFSFTVTAGTDTDLLAGDLDLKDPHDHADESDRTWLRYAAYAAAALFVFAATVVLLGRGGERAASRGE